MIPDVSNYSTDLLKALHILTPDGKLNQDSRRKLKQVNHLCQFIKPFINLNDDTFTLVDMGAGKSYLGFLLYDQFLKNEKSGKVIGVETRTELTEQSIQLAKKLNFERMNFLNLSVEQSLHAKEIPEKIQVVTALHACDTATDDALKFALTKSATHIVLVPCCQGEVATVLKKQKNKMLGKSALSEIWRHPLHTREFGSHLTNIMRCLLLESHGYQVTVTELVGWEHSMKNELILAKKSETNNIRSKQHLESILQELNLSELDQRFNY